MNPYVVFLLYLIAILGFVAVMLAANKYQIENLANLDELPETGATLIVGVLPVSEGSQAQARILALVPEPEPGDEEEHGEEDEEGPP